MQVRVTIPMLGVVDADAARTAPNGTPAGMAMPILVDVRERHEFAAIRAPGADRWRPARATWGPELDALALLTRRWPPNREARQAVRRRRLRRSCRNARVRSLWLNA